MRDVSKPISDFHQGKPVFANVPAALREAWPEGAAWWGAHEADIFSAIDGVMNILAVKVGRGDGEYVRVGDTVEFPGRGAVKRYAVAALRWALYDGKPAPIGYLAAMSGDPGIEAATLTSGMYGGIMRRLRFDAPIFYGKKARACYDLFAATVSKLGLTPPPFHQATEKPEQPEPPLPPSDTDDPDQADVVIRHTVQDGTTATWDEDKDRERPRDQSIYGIVRRGGFVKAHTAGGIYRRTNSVGLQETRAPIRSMVVLLHNLGLKVYLDLQTGETQEALRRRAEYKQERAERMMARGKRLSEEAARKLDRAAEAADDEIRKMPIPGYFPTPTDIAARVVQLADIANAPEVSVLDPSAGHGALLQAVRAVAPDVEADAVEINPRLRALIQKQGFPVVAGDIFDPEFNPGTLYDRIVMNPPYEEGATIDHVQRAYNLLRPGGVLVAVVPESIRYRQDKRHTAFRAWLEAHGAQEEDLDRARFGRAADIKTFILILRKPEDAEAVAPDERTVNRISLARADAEQVSERASAEASQAASRDWDRLRELVGLANRGEITKPQAAELRALRQKAQAADIMARAARIKRSAVRQTAQDVSKGGRSADYRPSRPTASQPTGEYMNEMRDLMAKIKGRVGATKLERGWLDGCSISYTLRWQEQNRIVTANVSVRLLGEQQRYYPKCEVPSPTGVQIDVFARGVLPPAGDCSKNATERLEVLEPAAIFDRLASIINENDCVQKFKAMRSA